MQNATIKNLFSSSAGNGDVDLYTCGTNKRCFMMAGIASNFSGRSDTQKLITAMESLKTSMGADFPYGGVQMSATDHQGKSPVYVYKIQGQQENVLTTIPADQVPAIGDCHV